MANTKEHRRTYFVDPQVQGAILRQAVNYWLYGAFIYCLIVSAFRIVPPWIVGDGMTLGEAWYHLSPLIASSIILLPIVLFSAVRFSHRFAGPMTRFRQILKKLAHGESVPPFGLRSDDFWKDVAEQLNQVSAKLGELSSSPARDRT